MISDYEPVPVLREIPILQENSEFCFAWSTGKILY